MTSAPIVPYPDVGGVSPIDGYSLARSETLIKLRSMIRTYKEKLTEHLFQESNQIIKYFDNMVVESEERQKKASALSKDNNAFQQQKRSLELEKQARLIELKKKMTLKVDLKLLNLLSVVMPKFVIPLKLTSKRNFSIDLPVVWNPLSGIIEPILCPQCHKPTLELIADKQGLVHCPQCNK